METATTERTVWKFPVTDDLYAPDGYLSPSQVTEYLDCPQCYYLNRVLRTPKPSSVHLAIGSYVHGAMEVVGKALLAGAEPVLEEALAAGEADFDANQVDEEGLEVEIDWKSYETSKAEAGKPPKELAKRDARIYAGILAQAMPPILRQRGLIAVETDLSQLPTELLARAYPFPVKGRIDALYGDRRGASGISDYKTASRRGGPDMNNVIQFGMYGLPAWVGGINWKIATDILVKTQNPYLLTYWAGEGSGHIADREYEAVRGIVLSVAERINRGDFPIGKGWNGSHDYDHGLPVFGLAVAGFAEEKNS